MKARLNKKAIAQINAVIVKANPTAVIVDVLENAKHNTIVIAMKDLPNVLISNIPCTPQDKSFKNTANKTRQALSRAIAQNKTTESI